MKCLLITILYLAVGLAEDMPIVTKMTGGTIIDQEIT